MGAGMASNALETGLIALIFNNTNLANIGDATGPPRQHYAGELLRLSPYG